MRAPPYILLVEDSPGDARLTQELLGDLGQSGLPSLRWVQSADAALTTLRLSPSCQAVLLDLGLPDSQGLETLKAVAKANSKMPIIVLTSDESAPLPLDALAAGAQDFLVKGSFNAGMLKRSIAFATHRKQNAMGLFERALRDELTGLPGRMLLLDRLRDAIQHAAATGEPSALLFLELSRSTEPGDEHGPAASDAIVLAVAERLTAAVGRTDTVARLGGGEFAVMLSSARTDADAFESGQALLHAISEPVSFEGKVLPVSANIGVTRIVGESTDAGRLIQQAYAAMYASKAQGKGLITLF